MEPKLACGTCGTPLTNGFCPRCLLDVGLSPEPDERPASFESAPPLARLGDYELLEEVGRGGMGVVYRARQVSLDRVVAVKLLPFGGLGDSASALRLRAEAVAAGSLRHPNIVTIHEVGLHQGQHFLAMDFVDGPSLGRVLRDGPLPAQRAAVLVRKIALAVQHAHERGIIHRDLKPSNILLDPADDEPRVTDFGLAKNLRSDTQLTLTGQTLGSPNYIPPEQIRGSRSLETLASPEPAVRSSALTRSEPPEVQDGAPSNPDPRPQGPIPPPATGGKVSFASDVYALGAILYHTLTGRPPFIGDDIAAVLQQVMHEEPLAPRRLHPSVPADLETISLKCLEKEPTQRYATAQELAGELERFLNGEPIRARPLSAPEKLWRWCCRKPALATAYGLLLLLLLVILFGSPLAAYRINQARKAETVERLRADAQLYAHEVNLANEALAEANLGRARQLLERQIPSAGETNDLRGFEWRYVYGQARSDEAATLKGPGAPLTEVRFAPHGHWLAATDGQGNVKLWDHRTRREITAFPAHTNSSKPTPFQDQGFNRALAIYPDGKRLAVGVGNTIALWDAEARRQTAVLERHSNTLRYLAFSSDGQTLASASQDGAVKLWNVRLNPPGVVAELNVGDDVHCLTFSFDSRVLAISAAPQELRLWDVSTPAAPRELSPINAHTGSVIGLAFSPVTNLLASCGSDIKLWHLGPQGEATPLRTLRGRGGSLGIIFALAFSPNGQILASAGSDRNLTLWDLSGANREPVKLKGHGSEVWSVAFSPDGGTVASASYDGTVKLWDVASPWPGTRQMSHGAFMNAVAFSPDSRFLASAAHSAKLKLWDAATEQQIAALDIVLSSGPLAFSPDGNVLATHDARGIHLLTIPSLVEITNFRGKLPTFSSDGAELIYYRDRSIRWRNLQTQSERVWKTEWSIERLAVSPDGQRAAASVGDGKNGLRLWHAAAPDQPLELERHDQRIWSLAFSPDSQWLVSGSWDGTNRLWNVANPSRPAVSLAAHNGAGWAAAFSSDGRTLATGGDDHTIRLWHLASFQLAATLRGHNGAVTALAFARDGRRLASTSNDGTVRIWRAPTLEEIAAQEKAKEERR